MLILKQPNGIDWCDFQLHLLHKAAKCMAKLKCGDLQPEVCLSRGNGVIKDHPSIPGCPIKFFKLISIHDS